MMDEQGKGLSLHPWGRNTAYYEGSDDGGTVYELPEGYELAETRGHDLGIFDPDGRYCDLILHLGEVALQSTTGGGRLIKVLKESEDQDFQNPTIAE